MAAAAVQPDHSQSQPTTRISGGRKMNLRGREETHSVQMRRPSASHYARIGNGVNGQYVADPRDRQIVNDAVAASQSEDDGLETSQVHLNVDPAHWLGRGEWDSKTLKEAASSHCMATWGPSKVVDSLTRFVKAEGCYLYDEDGKAYLDWTSQAVCSNLGHTVPESVKGAIADQLEEVPFMYGGLGLVDARIRLAKLMDELTPEEITGFLFASGGGEANEAAIRIARRFSGRHKILTQYRSYHGGTTSALTATGDFRRFFAESGTTGFVKIFNPQPFGFTWGDDDSQKTETCLAILEEQINMEGPETIAAIMLESIVGAGGALVPPRGYMEGVRRLCDKYNVLLILDEVMVGFGRTGKFWGFDHYDNVVPDIVTGAKGLSAAYLPLSVVGVNSKIQEFFREHPLGWGATYANHPVALSCAYEVLKHSLDHDLTGNARALEVVMVEELEKIVQNHSSVRQARAIGLFGCIDLIGSDGRMIQKYQEPSPSKVLSFKKEMTKNGLIGLFRPPLLHCAPPLTITEAELRDGFRRLDLSLKVLDF